MCQPTRLTTCSVRGMSSYSFPGLVLGSKILNLSNPFTRARGVSICSFSGLMLGSRNYYLSKPFAWPRVGHSCSLPVLVLGPSVLCSTNPFTQVRGMNSCSSGAWFSAYYLPESFARFRALSSCSSTGLALHSVLELLPRRVLSYEPWEWAPTLSLTWCLVLGLPLAGIFCTVQGRELLLPRLPLFWF